MPRAPEDITYWRNAWYAAKHNMPKRHRTNTGWAMLGFLLYGKRGLCMKVYNATTKGIPPKEENLRDALIAFSGPYGKVFARAVMLRRGMDPTQFIW